jgi:rubrerythrin
MHMEGPQLGARGGRRSDGVPRAALFKRVAISLGGLSAGGAVGAGLASASLASKRSSLSSRDREVLEFALRFEQLQTAFYSRALSGGKLTGEFRQFAEVVSREERDHLRYVEHALGHSTPPPPLHFGEATDSNAKFIAAAVTIEDTGLAAYNGQAENMSRATLKSVARVISVEARHAAWARSLAGKLPAPVPADVPITASAALKTIKPYLGRSR